MKKICLISLLLLGLLVACGGLRLAPTVTPAPPVVTATTHPNTSTPWPTQPPPPTAIPTAIPTPTRPLITSPSYRALIKVSTTSDWTTLHLASGGYMIDTTVTSFSQQAQSAGMEGESLLLSQPLSQAGGAESVQLVAEASFTGLEADSPLVFEIERGHIGSTQVEISSLAEITPTLVAVLTWDGLNPGERNTQDYQVSPQPFLGSAPNEYIVIAQLNFWYYGPGPYGGFENADGSRSTPLTPLLGETYWASDPAVVYQQIEWAVEYGVDAFSIEWTTPRGVGCCGSMEDTLDDVLLKSPNINKVRWAIFYDFVLRLMQTPDLQSDVTPNINFDQPDTYNTFVNDFVHFATKYFSNPQYLTIDGRPVVYIWATNSYIGNLAGAMQEARQRVADLGYDVFIVGDEVCVGCFNRAHAALFDGSSTFTMLIPGLDGHSMHDVGQAATQVDYAFQWWTSHINGLQVTGRNDLVNFQPAWAPQYDERNFITDNPLYVPALSMDQVTQMATVARTYAQPVGSSGLKLIWLNTWNNWAETTTVEPTADLGPRYPAGNYQFDMLEVVRNVFGVETYYTSPVR